MKDIPINRNSIVNSTLSEFSMKPLQTLRKKVRIEFKNEAGYDVGIIYFKGLNNQCNSQVV